MGAAWVGESQNPMVGGWSPETLGLEAFKLRKGDLGSGVARFRAGTHIWWVWEEDLRVGRTNGILEVFLTNQSHVLFYGFSGERVLAENKVLPFHEPVYLRHGHV